MTTEEQRAIARHMKRISIQLKGGRDAKVELRKLIAKGIADGTIPLSGSIPQTIESIGSEMFIKGLGVQADALQPEFMEMSERIVDLETRIAQITAAKSKLDAAIAASAQS